MSALGEGEHDRGGFPKDSPVFPFLNAIASSLQNAAPEKARELLQALRDHGVRLVVDQDLAHVFRARLTDGRKDVRCSIFGAEVVWAAALAYVTIHNHFIHNVGEDILFADNESTEFVPRLLEFAFDERLGQRSEAPWPPDLPGPKFARSIEEADTIAIATELWLLALAWILHHELSHVRLGHLDREDQRIEDESAADKNATDWLLDGVVDRAVLQKRSLGIAVAVVTLAGFALHRNARASSGRRTHPPAGERILAALFHATLEDEHPAQQLALLGVKTHLDRFGIAVPQGPFDTTSECLFGYCRALADWELRRD